MSTRVLYAATMRRGFIEFRRYAVDAISGIVSIYGFFLVIFLGAKIFGGTSPTFGEDIEGVVVAYGMWAFTVFTLGSLTFELTQEAQQGTLEQLGMSPFGLVQVLIARVVSAVAVYFCVWVVLLGLMMATTGRLLNIDVISVLPLLVVSLVSVVGLGFVMAGFAIVFKRVQQALQVYQVLIIGLVLISPEDVPFMKYLPLSWGASLLERVMADGISVFAIPAADLGFLALNSAIYFAIGVFIFTRFERVARARGLLGHY